MKTKQKSSILNLQVRMRSKFRKKSETNNKEGCSYAREHQIPMKDNRSNKKEHRVDAWALRADERRDKLRKASGRGTYPAIRRYLNGETSLRIP